MFGGVVFLFFFFFVVSLDVVVFELMAFVCIRPCLRFALPNYPRLRRFFFFLLVRRFAGAVCSARGLGLFLRAGSFCYCRYVRAFAVRSGRAQKRARFRFWGPYFPSPRLVLSFLHHDLFFFSFSIL